MTTAQKQSLEFKLISPKGENGFLEAIEFNYYELKAGVLQRLEKYENLVYNDENINEAKADRANLNKVKDAFENKRKEIKAKCLEPYAAFEVKIREIVELIEQPKTAIDLQVKTFEEKKKSKKLEKITDYYLANVDDLKEIVSLQSIFNEKWLNSGFAISNVEAEITEKFNKIRADLQAIEIGKSKFETEIKSTYLQGFDLSAALQKGRSLEEQDKVLEERKKQQQLQLQNQVEQAPQKVEVQGTVKEPLPVEQFGNSEQLIRSEFWMEATKEETMFIIGFLKEKGRKFGTLKKEKSCSE